MVPKEKDPFTAQCKNAPKEVNQTLCRKEQQMLYLALRHAQHAVDCITEEDILEGALKDLNVLYFAGEWIDNRVIPKLEEWVKAGGVLYCCAGCGHKNQFDEPEPAMRKLLGLKAITTTKNAYHMRTLLELPMCEAIDHLTLSNGSTVPIVAMKQELTADDAKPTGRWQGSKADVVSATQRKLGKGVVIAVGAPIATSYMRTAVKQAPWARGGRHTVYNPTEYDKTLHALIAAPCTEVAVEQPATCSNPLVESIVLDDKTGTLLTLVNWTNGPVKDVEVRVRMKDAPKTVRTISGQRDLEFSAKDGIVAFRIDVAEADYVLLLK
jgi:hypothetical protein